MPESNDKAGIEDDDLQIDFGPTLKRAPRQRPAPDRRPELICSRFGRDDANEPHVFLHADALAKMEDHLRLDKKRELGGLLMGHIGTDTAGLYVEILDVIRAPRTDSTGTSVRFTHETWRWMEREQEQTCPTLSRVGWYHSHPGFGVFLGHADVAIHKHFFSDPGQVAYVYDPVTDRRSFFHWSDGKLRAVGGFLLFADKDRADDLKKTLLALSRQTAARHAQEAASAARLSRIRPDRLQAVRIHPRRSHETPRDCAMRWYGRQDTDRPRVFVSLASMMTLDEHGDGDRVRMLGGLLMGRIGEDVDGLYVQVLDVLPARFVENDSLQIRFTRATWDDLAERCLRRCPDLQRVGWYHTNPGHGVFLSDADVYIHRHFFDGPGQIAYVYDPVHRRRAFFRWSAGKIQAVRGFALFAATADGPTLADYLTALESHQRPL